MSNPALIIRRLTTADADAYVALRSEMLIDSPFSFIGAPGDDVASDAAFVRAQLALDEYALYAACREDQPARLLAVAGIRRETRTKLRHRAGIWGVYTTPAARGQGLSRRVVTACIDIARTWPGVVVIGLSVSQRASIAQRLYLDLGFNPWGTQPESIRVDGESDTEIHMQLYLPEAVRNSERSNPNNSGT